MDLKEELLKETPEKVTSTTRKHMKIYDDIWTYWPQVMVQELRHFMCSQIVHGHGTCPFCTLDPNSTQASQRKGENSIPVEVDRAREPKQPARFRQRGFDVLWSLDNG